MKDDVVNMFHKIFQKKLSAIIILLAKRLAIGILCNIF